MTDDTTKAAPAIAVKPGREWKHSSPLMAARFDPIGRYLFVTAQDNSIQRVDLPGGKVTPYVGHDSWVRALAFHPRRPVLYSGGYDGRVIEWSTEAEAPRPSRVVDAHDGWVRAVAVSPDGSTLASCGNDGLVKLWSTEFGQATATLTGHGCHVYNVIFHPNGKSLVSADLKGVLKEWDLATGKAVREFDAKALYKYDGGFRADIGGVRSIAFTADGRVLACAGITDVSNAFAGVGKPAVVLVDWATGKSKPLLRPKEEFQGVACGLAFHPSGLLFGAGGGSGGALWAWTAEQDRSAFTLKLPTNARDLAMHPDGKRLAVAFADNVARLYDVTAG